MSEEGDFVTRLLSMLREDGGDNNWPTTCDYDESARTALLTYARPAGDPRVVRLELPIDGVRAHLAALTQDDLDVWGPGVDRVEAAARFASVHLQERVATRDDDPLVIRYGVTR
jgi:hypothetical protein